MEIKTEKKRRGLSFAWRVILACALSAGVIAGVYLLAYRAYSVTAEWKYADSHDVLLIDGARYRRVGTVGKDGLSSSTYPIGDIAGRVEDDGTVTKADDDPVDISREHTYVLYSVKNNTDVYRLLEQDGTHSLYWREVAEWESADNEDSFIYKGRRYERLGPVKDYGSGYGADKRVGFVSRDAKTSAAACMMSNVKTYTYLYVVKGTDGQQYLYCRVGERKPPSLADLL